MDRIRPSEKGVQWMILTVPIAFAFAGETEWTCRTVSLILEVYYFMTF